MKRNQWIAILAASFLIFCGGSVVNAAKYKSIKGGVKNGGTIKGKIILDGTAPPPKMLKVDKDTQVCGSDRPSEELVVNDGGIQNAVVFIDGIAKGKRWWKGSSKFVFDQKGCQFIPHVTLIKPKAKGTVLNSDAVGHNFHTISAGIYNINKKIKPNGKMKVRKGKIKKSGKVRVKCDLHPWMRGWWFIANSPYTVLTDEKGNYKLTTVPPGTYKIKVWQEKLGEVTQEVVVQAKKTTKLDIKMTLK